MTKRALKEAVTIETMYIKIEQLISAVIFPCIEQDNLNKMETKPELFS